MEEDLIRRYFKGELSESERVEVELRQLEDSEFASLMIDFKSAFFLTNFGTQSVMPSKSLVTRIWPSHPGEPFA